MAAGKRGGAELACTAELKVKKTSAFSGGAINTAGTHYDKGGPLVPPTYQRVNFGEHKRREARHPWL
jgi:hypothetical protein